HPLCVDDILPVHCQPWRCSSSRSSSLVSYLHLNTLWLLPSCNTRGSLHKTLLANNWNDHGSVGVIRIMIITANFDCEQSGRAMRGVVTSGVSGCPYGIATLKRWLRFILPHFSPFARL